MLGANIVSIRKAKGITQKELSEKAGIPIQTLVRYEKDQTENIPVSRIEKIASVLGVSASVLLGWDQEKDDLGGFTTQELLAEIEKRRAR